MLTSGDTLLLYGYGNPGRGDDGLGPIFASRFLERRPRGVTVDSNYQLELEDAATLAEFDTAIFVDADRSGPEPFWFDRVRPTSRVGWTSHGMTAEALVFLTEELFGKKVEAYTLGIRGYEFDELKEDLTEPARKNLEMALEFSTRALEEQQFEAYVERYGLWPRGPNRGQITRGYPQ